MPKGTGYTKDNPKPENEQTIPRPGSKDKKVGGRKMERNVKIHKDAKKKHKTMA